MLLKLVLLVLLLSLFHSPSLLPPLPSLHSCGNSGPELAAAASPTPLTPHWLYWCCPNNCCTTPDQLSSIKFLCEAQSATVIMLCLCQVTSDGLRAHRQMQAPAQSRAVVSVRLSWCPAAPICDSTWLC